MTLLELSKLLDYGNGHIEVKSGYNGKLLCKRFNEKKHESIANREVVAIWPEIKVDQKRYCSPIICCFVDGHEELEHEMARRKKLNA